MRARLARVPALVLGLLIGLVHTLTIALLDVAQDDFRWGSAVVRLLCWSALGTLVAWWDRRYPTSRAMSPARRAVYLGELPAGEPDPDLHDGLLHVKRRALTRRRLGGAGFAVLAVLTVAVTLVTGRADGWAFATLAVIVAVVVVAVSTWQAQDADRLLAELDARSAG